MPRIDLPTATYLCSHIQREKRHEVFIKLYTSREYTRKVSHCIKFSEGFHEIYVEISFIVIY